MYYKHPFILYLNITVSLILLLLVLPTLLNRREALKVRVAFSLIFSKSFHMYCKHFYSLPEQL